MTILVTVLFCVIAFLFLAIVGALQEREKMQQQINDLTSKLAQSEWKRQHP